MSLFEGLLCLSVHPFSVVEATRPNSTAERLRHKMKSRKRTKNARRGRVMGTREDRIAHTVKGGSRISQSQSQKTLRKTVNPVSASVQLSQLSGCWSRSQVVTCGENRTGHSNF